MVVCAYHAGEVARIGVVRAAQHAWPHQKALLLHLHADEMRGSSPALVSAEQRR